MNKSEKRDFVAQIISLVEQAQEAAKAKHATAYATLTLDIAYKDAPKHRRPDFGPAKQKKTSW